MSEITCPNCQSRLPATASFCDNCGTDLRAALAGSASAKADNPGHTGDLGAPTCPNCGTPYQPGQAVCSECDATLPLPNEAPKCHVCQNELRPGAKFCDNCGTPVALPQAAAAPPKPVIPQTVLESAPRPAPLAPDRTMLEPVPRNLYVTGRLVIVATGQRLEFPPQRTEINVGREDPVSNIFPEIDLTPYGGEAGGVSRHHARFGLLGGELVVEDLDSTNFTFVNKKRVLPGTRQVVRHGDEVRFGRIVTRYEE